MCPRPAQPNFHDLYAKAITEGVNPIAEATRAFLLQQARIVHTLQQGKGDPSIEQTFHGLFKIVATDSKITISRGNPFEDFTTSIIIKAPYTNRPEVVVSSTHQGTARVLTITDVTPEQAMAILRDIHSLSKFGIKLQNGNQWPYDSEETLNIHAHNIPFLFNGIHRIKEAFFPTDPIVDQIYRRPTISGGLRIIAIQKSPTPAQTTKRTALVIDFPPQDQLKSPTPIGYHTSTRAATGSWQEMSPKYTLADGQSILERNKTLLMAMIRVDDHPFYPSST